MLYPCFVFAGLYTPHASKIYNVNIKQHLDSAIYEFSILTEIETHQGVSLFSRAKVKVFSFVFDSILYWVNNEMIVFTERFANYDGPISQYLNRVNNS